MDYNGIFLLLLQSKLTIHHSKAHQTMRKAVIIIMLGFLLSCTHRQGRGMGEMPYGRVDAATDSLTEAFEKAFYDALPAESIAKIGDQVRIYPTDTPDIAREKRARIYLWKARIARKSEMPDSAIHYIREALSEVDSIRHYYTYRRILTLQSSLESGQATEYMKHLMADLDYYQSVGDEVMEASACILIANALTGSYQPDFALQYLNRADSLHKAVGLPKYVTRNKINTASAYFALNRRDKAVETLREALADSAMIEDKKAFNTVLRNLYIYTGEEKYLGEAYRRTMAMDSASAVNAVYEVLLSRYHRSDTTKEGKDLADSYAWKAKQRLPDITDHSHRSAVFQEVSRMYADKTRSDSAYKYLALSLEERDMDEEMRQPEEIARIRNIQILADHEYQQNKTKSAYTVRLLIMLIIVIVIISCSVYVIIKIKQRHRLEAHKMQMEKINTQLDMESRHRQYLAMSLAMEDTDRNLSEMRERLENLCREGKLTEKGKTEVENVMKTQAMHRNDWNRFNELFEETHPQFERNLRSKYPGLSESQLKLARYVYVGMDNKQIASYMNVRPESVKQARWRLRSKMGLKTEDSLEETLRGLVE